jgi:hypothetical protein
MQALAPAPRAAPLAPPCTLFRARTRRTAAGGGRVPARPPCALFGGLFGRKAEPPQQEEEKRRAADAPPSPLPPGCADILDGTVLQGEALVLSYDAARDGWTAAAFHAACDNKARAHNRYSVSFLCETLTRRPCAGAGAAAGALGGRRALRRVQPAGVRVARGLSRHERRLPLPLGRGRRGGRRARDTAKGAARLLRCCPCFTHARTHALRREASLSAHCRLALVQCSRA